jgi:outer membrane protein OmpA-like peptidoglycan-associated protein
MKSCAAAIKGRTLLANVLAQRETSRCALGAFIALQLAGCAPVQTSDSYRQPAATTSARVSEPMTQSQTIDLEASDRIVRFRRLADMGGTAPPRVDQLFAVAGTVPGVNAAVPVVRLVFEESALFDVNQSVPRPESAAAIQLVAANMRRDVPDAALTILGHTDAVGSATYNLALSKRRASTVLGQLMELGVNPNQLSTVAIGKTQPIAPNSTDIGRARNRRVEFLISGSEQANLSVIRDRAINSDYLQLGESHVPADVGAKNVEILKPVRQPVGRADEDILGPAGMLSLRSTPAGAP